MTAQAAAPSRRFALRERTTAAHAALDATVGELSSLGAYRSYLAGMAAFRIPVETALAAETVPAGFGSFRPTRIAEHIAADARDLGLTLAPAGPFAGPSTGSGLLGLLYVLEGSALGARLLQRQAAAIGLDAGFGARHLAAQGSSLEAWRGFCAVLEAWPDFDPDEAARGAVATFALAQRSFGDRIDAER